jgi:hypothetical protein
MRRARFLVFFLKLLIDSDSKTGVAQCESGDVLTIYPGLVLGAQTECEGLPFLRTHHGILELEE